uniref:Uncharacterized protein n=1 Tax=Trichogramma kaykai TaxID=54128 RepID=A0ABD2XNS8_9HYME
MDECLEAYASTFGYARIVRQRWYEKLSFSGGIANEAKFKLASDFINLVYLLRQKGYELKLSDAVTLMSQLNKLGVSKLWPKLSKVENVIGEHREEMKKWYEKEAKKTIVQENPKLSLYDLFELPPNAAARRLRYFSFVMQNVFQAHYQGTGYGTYIKQ